MYVRYGKYNVKFYFANVCITFIRKQFCHSIRITAFNLVYLMPYEEYIRHQIQLKLSNFIAKL